MIHAFWKFCHGLASSTDKKHYGFWEDTVNMKQIRGIQEDASSEASVPDGDRILPFLHMDKGGVIFG
jgi:hypothetical protein